MLELNRNKEEEMLSIIAHILVIGSIFGLGFWIGRQSVDMPRLNKFISRLKNFNN